MTKAKILLLWLVMALCLSACREVTPDPKLVEQAVLATLTASAPVSTSPTGTPVLAKGTVEGDSARYSFDQYLKASGGTMRDFLVQTDQELKAAAQFISDPQQIRSLCALHFEDTGQIASFLAIEPPEELESLHSFYSDLALDWKSVTQTKSALCANPSQNTAMAFAVAADKYNQDLLDLAELRSKLLEASGSK